MNIIILGAGQVGSSLAERLASERNDITLVDTDVERLKELQDLKAKEYQTKISNFFLANLLYIMQ